MLPTSARVAPVTYTAVVATRYSELCVKKDHKWCVGTFARGGLDDLPGGFHTVLWLQGGSSTAKMNVTVNAAFETLVDHHVWGEEAQESLYVMCNNSQDVTSLQHHTEAWNNPNKIRIETVASSASTTAKVAAVIQRGGSFLSGSFTDPIWAEDCAGRATVCLTRAISYTQSEEIQKELFGHFRLPIFWISVFSSFFTRASYGQAIGGISAGTGNH